MTTLFIATRNQHKVQEIRVILGGDYRYLTLNDVADAPEVVEDRDTFDGNAAKKAVELARWLGKNSTWKREPGAGPLLVLADDSGLEVDAIGGAPGVYSARFAAMDSGQGGNSPDADNNAKLLRLLKDEKKRGARFRCVIALTPVSRPASESASPVCYADEAELETELFEGACEGRIELAPRGAGGFGYDPLFVPNGYEQSFAELGEEIKNRLSHRAKALAKLKERLRARG